MFKQKMPVYLAIAILILWTGALVGCSIIPTSYTTNTQQKNLVRQNTLLQIEFTRRYENMDPKAKEEFLTKNVEFAIGIEEIICGEESDAREIYKRMIEEKDNE